VPRHIEVGQRLHLERNALHIFPLNSWTGIKIDS